MVTIDAARTQWSSAEVLSGITRLAAEGRAVTVDLIALLAVLDERRLYEAEGCGSLFEFCVTRLRLSESQAYHRIQAARAAACFPVILDRLREGTVTLTSIALLRPVLTEPNHAQLLANAAGRSKREVEGLVRSLAPLPDVRTSIRRLVPRPTEVIAAPPLACDRAPAPITEPSRAEEQEALEDGTLTAGSQAPCGITAASARHAEIRPLAPARYSLRVTISEETHGKLRRCQDLLGHAVPDGDPAAVLDRALTLLLASLEQRRFAAKTRRSVDSRPSRRRRTRCRRSPATPPTTTAGSREVAAVTSDAAVRPHEGPGLASQAAETSREGAAASAAASSPVAVVPPDAAGRPSRPPEPDVREAARPRGRHIPAAVRRAVWERDQGRCGYVGHGGRCTQTRRLEFHHCVPFADGGAATIENLSLRCRVHNGTEARRWGGDAEAARDDSDRSKSLWQVEP